MPTDCPTCGSKSLPTPEEMKALRAMKPRKTLKIVSKAMGVSESYLCDLENGRRDWNADLIERFRKALKR
jgi:predicted transcriptional regulator